MFCRVISGTSERFCLQCVLANGKYFRRYPSTCFSDKKRDLTFTFPSGLDPVTPWIDTNVSFVRFVSVAASPPKSDMAFQLWVTMGKVAHSLGGFLNNSIRSSTLSAPLSRLTPLPSTAAHSSLAPSSQAPCPFSFLACSSQTSSFS